MNGLSIMLSLAPEDFPFTKNPPGVFTKKIAAKLKIAATFKDVSETLRVGGERLSEVSGLHFITTDNNVHDVTFGQAPFGDLFFCEMLSRLYNFDEGGRILDFGCSTGRVIRNLKSVFGNIDAFGCDPRQTSIDFIAPRVPEVNWFTSKETPPLDSADASFDMVFAISVWSHFSEDRSLEWFDEMARVVRPGGNLIFTTHGRRSIFHITEIKKAMRPEKTKERLDALEKGRFHYMRYPKGSEFNEHWGMAFIPEQWCEENLRDKWELTSFHPGLAMANQDAYVLTRKQ